MSRSLIYSIHLCALVVTVVGLLASYFLGANDWIIPFSTIPMLNIMLIPFEFQKERKDLFNPLIVFIISLLIGTILRSFFIVSDLESKAKPLMLMGHENSLMFTGILHIYLGVVFFVIGYSIFQVDSLRSWSNSAGFKINPRALVLTSLIIIPISIVSAYLYFQQMGLNLFTIFFSEDISAKRFVQLEEGGFSALGYYRKIMDLVRIMYFFFLVYYIKTSNKGNNLIIILLLLTGLLSIFFHFINSSRSQALEVILFTFIVIYYLKGRISKKLLIPGVGFILILLISMTFLRYQSGYGDEANREDPFTIVVGSTNFLGVGKASFIANSVPERMSYQYGRTLFLWVVAPVPRTLWQNKPETSIGREIGEKIYKKRDENLKAGGVPPGFITELYLNFGVFGIILGMFLFGVLLKYVYRKLYAMRTQSVFGLLFYVLGMLPFMIITIGGDFSRGVIFIISTLIPLFLLTYLVRTN